METLTSSNPRSNGDGGNEVGTCFVISSMLPEFSYLIAVVDLPVPSEGFVYNFTTSFQNGWLTYDYESDPNSRSDTPLQTFILPPFPISKTAIDNNTIQTVSVNDSTSRQVRKNGTVSTIQFTGKWGKVPHSKVAMPEPDDLGGLWNLNAFVIQSYTYNNQYFIVATMDIYPGLDSYDGPYAYLLAPGGSMGGGNLQVTVQKPVPPDQGQIKTNAIYTDNMPENTSFGSYTVWGVSGASTGNTSDNYNPNITTANPDACI